MKYSIGEVASITGITISTLRYYDREGLFPNMERGNGGIRRFNEAEMESLRIIECLKNSGLSIKAIKLFLDWCQEGDSTLEERRELFYERLGVVEKQIEELQKTMNTLRFKCWYYDTAVSFGSEKALKDLNPDKIPEDVLKYKVDDCLD
ncbi:MerR family transcriptional regulator [Anaeropeptidivorans aminofermentans]|jgi:DNA-binding transcriptional MerR regulator|uniref:MerR family transcriptional regulator n=1 Tax=Anaeropeptidivorans aminofermentans TaxID=2934315 RepID=UPI002ED5B686